jgi:hypothetical protein
MVTFSGMGCVFLGRFATSQPVDYLETRRPQEEKSKVREQTARTGFLPAGRAGLPAQAGGTMFGKTLGGG